MTINVRSNDPVEVTPKADEGQKAEPAGKTEPTSAQESEKHSEQNEESEAPEASETEGNESESEHSESDQDEESKDSVKEEKPKKKGGFQRRIDKLNAAKAAAQQEAEYWRQQALKNAGHDSKQQPQADPKKSSSPEAGKPSPDAFDTHAEYVEALTDWKVDQKEKAREAKDQKSRFEAEQAKLVKSHIERVKSFADKTDDFQEVLESVDDIPVSPAIREIILQAENGPELMYELAKNRDEYARICKLSPLACAREMGKIESKLAAKSSPEKKVETKKITKAPKPIEPVGTGGKGSAGKSIFDPNLSQSEYEKLRQEQIKKRRQA